MTAITHTFRFSGAGEDFGPRSFGMVTGHTWEGPYNALTVADGIELLKWQDADSVLGSYNRVCCVDGVISSVPDGRASGGINPGSDFWAPKAWLRDHFSAEEIANPNYFTLNVVALGRRQWFDTNGWPEEIIDGMARSWIDEERRTGIRIVWTGHSDFQSNRSDCGAIATALVKKRYAELTGSAPQEIEDMQFWRPVQEQWKTRIGGRFWDGSGNAKTFATGEVVLSVAESSDGLYRLVKYPPTAPNELLVMERAGLWPYPDTRVPASPAYGFPPPEVITKTVEKIVEKIVEVPTGITEEDVQAAQDAAAEAEQNRIAAAEAARIRAI